MSYTQLFFDSIITSITTTKLTLDPHVPKCPNCGALDQRFVGKPTFTYQASKVYDKNQLVTTAFTCCGAQISLYVAVHKEINALPQFCIQKSSEEGAAGIPTDWWNIET